MLFAGARLREISVVVLYIGICGAVAKLAGLGWTTGIRARRLFLDDTFVFVAIVMCGHSFLRC